MPACPRCRMTDCANSVFVFTANWFGPIRRGIRVGAEGVERNDRSTAGVHRALPERRRRAERRFDLRARTSFRSRFAAAATMRPGSRSCDGGMVIDLRGMRDVVVDPRSRTARAGGGATWGDFDRATAVHGLATTGGADLDDGHRRTHARRRARLVDAELRHDVRQPDRRRSRHGRRTGCCAPARRRTPICSGRCAAAAATSASSRPSSSKLHPVSTVLGGMFLYPLARARDVLRFYRDFDAVGARRAHGVRGDDAFARRRPVVALGDLLQRSGDGRRARDQARFAISERRSPAQSARCRTRRFRRCSTPGSRRGCRFTGARSSSRRFRTSSIEAARVGVRARAVAAQRDSHRAVRRGRAPSAARDTAFDNRDSDSNLVIVSRWADPRGRRAKRRVGEGDVGRGEAVHERARVRQLHRRWRGAGSRARGVQRREVRATVAGQAKVRSDERVSDQSEHCAWVRWLVVHPGRHRRGDTERTAWNGHHAGLPEQRELGPTSVSSCWKRRSGTEVDYLEGITSRATFGHTRSDTSAHAKLPFGPSKAVCAKLPDDHARRFRCIPDCVRCIVSRVNRNICRGDPNPRKR